MFVGSDINSFVQDTNSLIELCRKVVEQLRSDLRSDPKSSMEPQLQAIAKAIEKLEKQNVEVPEAFRAEKTKLASGLAIHDETIDKLKFMGAGFSTLTSEIESTLAKYGETKLKNKKKIKRSTLPKTDNATLRRHIVSALSKMGGAGKVADVLREIELQLEGEILPGDLELRQDGKTLAWPNNAQWVRFRMVKDGTLRNDSANGVWELNE